MTSPTPGRLLGGGRPAASHASAVELRRTRWGAAGHPTSNRLGYHCASVSAASVWRQRDSSWMGISWAAGTGYSATPPQRPARTRRPRRERPRSHRPRSPAPVPPRPRRRAPRGASPPDSVRARQLPNPAPRQGPPQDAAAWDRQRGWQVRVTHDTYRRLSVGVDPRPDRRVEGRSAPAPAWTTRSRCPARTGTHSGFGSHRLAVVMRHVVAVSASGIPTEVGSAVCHPSLAIGTRLHRARTGRIGTW